MRVFGLIVSVVSLAGVIYWASRQDAPDFPGGAHAWLMLAAAVGTYAVATVLRAERWLALLREGGEQAPRSDTYGLTVVGLMGNSVLPARGGDALRVVYMSRRAGRGFRDITGSLIAERLLDVAIVSGIYIVLAQVVLTDAPAPDLPSGLDLVVLIGAAVLALAALAYALHHFNLLDRAKQASTPLLAASRRLRGAHLASMLALTAVIWLLEAVNMILIAASIEFDLDLIGALYVIGIGGILIMIPSGPGHAGTFDTGIVLGAVAAGASGQVALSFLLIARLAIFVPATIAGLALVLGRYGWTRPEPSGG